MTFSYGLTSRADKARLARQNGFIPEDHLFQPLETCPTMCEFPGCFATLAANKPWHLQPEIVVPDDPDLGILAKLPGAWRGGLVRA